MATKSAASRSRSKSASKAKSKRQPWDKPAPRGSRHTKLTKPQKAEAKAAAKRAGRRYPNLVDNMRAAGGKRKKRGKKS
jgi:hypothetical protein